MKNFKRITLVLIFAFAMMSILNAQENKALMDAFSNSYGYEYKADYTKAIECLKKEYKEDSYELNLRLGWLSYMQGLFTESTTYYHNAIKIMPLAIEPKLGIALPESALGNWDKVKATYQEILKIDPQNSGVNYKLGLYYYGKQDYTNAYKYFEKVVNLYPFDYSGNLYLGWTNLKLGKLREAKVLFNKVLLNKPSDASALEGLGMIK